MYITPGRTKTLQLLSPWALDPTALSRLAGASPFNASDLPSRGPPLLGDSFGVIRSGIPGLSSSFLALEGGDESHLNFLAVWGPMANASFGGPGAQEHEKLTNSRTNCSFSCQFA